MSRMATNEYIGAKRRAYAQADRAKRTRILDEVCETTGYERKYANRLLTGNRKFRERKGRGRTYGDDVAAVLKKVWREAECPCLPYFKAGAERWVEEYATQVAHISSDIMAQLLAMSDRTMSRLLSGEVRVALGRIARHKHSANKSRAGLVNVRRLNRSSEIRCEGSSFAARKRHQRGQRLFLRHKFLHGFIDLCPLRK